MVQKINGHQMDGLLYLTLHKQLQKNVGMDNVICRKKFYEILGKHFLVPKNLRDVVIKEMEKMKLVKIDSRDAIIVLGCCFDLEEDVNKFYRVAGICG